jgi:RimJ/RimL family protein N-acetyltransferase
VTELVEADGLRLRRASADDVDFLLELVTHQDVEPFLAGRSARTREELLEELERQQAEPREFGRLVIEVSEDGEWRRAGAMGFEVGNRRSRIARLGRLAVHPDFRGRRLSDDAARLLQRYLLFDLDYHRLELEIYGFNERALHHAERSGFVREGVKRKAYWRHGEWTDGVLYGLVREDLEHGEGASPQTPPYP